MYLFVIYLIICIRWAIPPNSWFLGLSVEDSVEKSDVNCLIIGLLMAIFVTVVLCNLNLYLCNLLPCSLWHTALYYSVYSPADLSFPQDREEGITLSGYILYILPVINTPHLPLLYASFPATHFLFVQPFFRPGSNHIKILSFWHPHSEFSKKLFCSYCNYCKLWSQTSIKLLEKNQVLVNILSEFYFSSIFGSRCFIL